MTPRPDPDGPRRSGLAGAFGLLMATAVAAPLHAQEVPRDEYLFQMPLSLPQLVPQTEASEVFHLFGDRSDPAYRDEEPVDGIDDRRYDVLRALALRFAPFMVQNTDNFPTNFQHFIDNRDSFPLWIDTWDVSGAQARRVGTRGVNFSVLGRAECDRAILGRAFEIDPEPSDDPVLEDCKVLELMERFTPGGGGVRAHDETLVREQPRLVDVAFFNMPGEGEGSWDGVYVAEVERTPPERRASFPHSFVHPFVAERFDDDGRSTGYELVIQYWFYYPTNDSGMNHEGDWEHINVIVSPRSQVTRPMSATMLERVLDGSLPATDDAPDPLVIRRVDYYLHHLVMPLDFSSPNAYLPRAAWEADVRERPETRFRERVIWDEIRYMAFADDAESVVNTHPLVHIGADNKGLNQALEVPGPGNQDPHASYPFPGRYPNVGPGGTTDQVDRSADLRAVLEAFRRGALDPGPTLRGGSVLPLADPGRLRILPDWERLPELARSDAAVRRDWAWMLLPIRWGYPATRSPFSGILEHFNTGNVAPIGPSYNTAWNVSGAAPGYTYYEPHTLPDLFPIQVQDNFRNDLGFLNLTLPVLFNLPPLDFVSRLVAYPFRLVLGNPSRVYYPNESLPYRFFGVSAGVSYQVLEQDYDALTLNADQYESLLASIALHVVASGGDANTEVVSGSDYKSNAVSPYVNVPFYLGDHVVSENTVRNVRATFGGDVVFSDIPTYSYRSDFNLWEYAGSIRYLPFLWRVAPYAKGGYGWSWYRLENARSGLLGPLSPANSSWMGPESLWPNVWHYGLGVEFVPWRRTGAGWGGVELGLRLEYTRFVQRLELDLDTIPLDELGLLFKTLADLPDTDVARNDFVIALTLSF